MPVLGTGWSKPKRIVESLAPSDFCQGCFSGLDRQLTSSAYGPDESFRAIAAHPHLAGLVLVVLPVRVGG
jgi:hypothetical protein